MTIDKFGRPDWELYFITLAHFISLRSIDKHTKCGCVVTDRDNTILSVGYNGPPRGCNDSNIPLERPFKYALLAHAEHNSVVNAARSGISLKDSIFYVTSHPCHLCLGTIKSVGASRVIYGTVATKCVDENSLSVIRNILDCPSYSVGSNYIDDQNNLSIHPAMSSPEDILKLMDLGKEIFLSKCPPQS